MVNKSDLRLLASRLGLSMLIFTLCRLLFFAFNPGAVNVSGFSVMITLMVGLRIDASAVAMTHAPLIILSLIPGIKKEKIMHVLFILTNALGLLSNLIDVEYFKFIGKRTTIDVLDLMASGSDFWNLLPRFLVDYWYVPAGCIALVWLLIRVDKRFMAIHQRNTTGTASWKFYITSGIVTLALTVLAIRGGVQMRPIGTASVAQYVEPEMIPFALNTPFTFIKSASGTHLSKVDFMSEEEADRRISTLRQSRSNAFPFQPNVIVIILESFSSEFTATGPGPSYTPFLDSLMKEGTGFPEAYANGRKSIEGLPSILAGIPALSDQPFISSVYAGNRIDALPALLASEGYHTSFFHGVDKGTMGFDDFCGLAGIKHYYGRESYEDIHGEDGYDGTWGIFDHRYFAYFSSEISHFPEPFFTTLFSVSSHHPYRVPDDYQDRVIAGDHPLQTVISYTDIALRELFERLKKEDFYQRTLFVITADHTGTPVSEKAHGPKDAFAVPILYFMPGRSLPESHATVTQHIDIFPSILDLTVNRKDYFCFGTSIFSKDHRNAAVTFTQGVYQWITNDQVLQHVPGSMTQKLNNTGEALNAGSDENLLNLEAFIQQYNNHLINNTMTCKR